VSSLILYTSVAVGTGSVHPPVMEEEINSIPISPSSSQGPLSPKTPTTMKSTLQVKMECADSDHQLESHLSIDLHCVVSHTHTHAHARTCTHMRIEHVLACMCVCRYVLYMHICITTVCHHHLHNY